MRQSTCFKGCCTIKQLEESEIIIHDNDYYEDKQERRKGGVLMHDTTTDKVLLIQSVSGLFGAPKGTLEGIESFERCAQREFNEETGLEVSVEEFEKAIHIGPKIRYYYVKRKECEVNVTPNSEYNDVIGISWIKLSCLQDMVTRGKLKLTFHARYLFDKWFGLKINNKRRLI